MVCLFCFTDFPGASLVVVNMNQIHKQFYHGTTALYLLRGEPDSDSRSPAGPQELRDWWNLVVWHFTSIQEATRDHQEIGVSLHSMFFFMWIKVNIFSCYFIIIPICHSLSWFTRHTLNWFIRWGAFIYSPIMHLQCAQFIINYLINMSCKIIHFNHQILHICPWSVPFASI